MNNPTTSGIYKIVNTDGTVYVGSAVNLKKRWNNHRYELRAGKHPNTHMQRAWAKHGEESFTFEVLEYVLVKEDLIACEQKWIDATKTSGIPMYNLRDKAGSQLGLKHSEETKALISQQKAGKPLAEETKQKLSSIRKGRTLSPEHRAALSAARKGRTVSEATRAKLSEAGKKRKASPETIERMRQSQLGKTLTEEHKQKIGRSNSNRNKNVESVSQ